MSMDPLISIIIPTYNRSHLIKETITSIQNQTYTHWECIIVDDASTDDTESTILKIIKNDSRIVFYSKPKHLLKGPSASRNYGFSKSKGEYVNFFDSDDIMLPEKLELDLKNINSGDYDFTICQSEFFKEKGEPQKKYWRRKLWSSDPINDFIRKTIGWSTNAPLWNKNKLETLNLIFNEKLMTSDDYLFHLQALKFKLKPFVLEQVLVKQREHADRLENFKIKSNNKIIVLLFIFQNKNELVLNNETLNLLYKKSFAHLSNLFKHREWLKGFYYSFKLLPFQKGFYAKRKIIALLLGGTFFKITSKGYKFLK